MLIGSLIANAWLGYSIYLTEQQNRQALAYPAERVTYRLSQLTRFADPVTDAEWADVSTRTWMYDSVREIVDFGLSAERIETRGRPAEVAYKLGQLARVLQEHVDDAHRLAFGDQSQAREARATLQGLAQEIKAAGWDPAIRGGGTPAGWTYGRDWAELNNALDRLLK